MYRNLWLTNGGENIGFTVPAKRGTQPFNYQLIPLQLVCETACKNKRFWNLYVLLGCTVFFFVSIAVNLRVTLMPMFICRKIHSAAGSSSLSQRTGWGISASMNLWTCSQSSVKWLLENSRPYMPSKYTVARNFQNTHRDLSNFPATW